MKNEGMRGALAVMLVIGSLGVAARGLGQRADVGPAIGERVPDFTLTDQSGRQHSLQSVMGPKGAILVFFRSADW